MTVSSHRRRSQRQLTLLPLLIVSAALAAPYAAQAVPSDNAILYVAPGGSDTANGTQSKPFASLAHALQAARESKGIVKEVRLRGGVYSVSDPVAISAPGNSGSDSPAPLLVTADRPGDSPVLSGGVRLTGWKRVTGSPNRWQTTLPEAAGGKWTFQQLYVNGERRYRPRLPKRGWDSIAAEMTPSAKAAGKGFDRFRYRPGDIDPAWSNRGDIEVLVTHIWTMSRFRIADIDPTDRSVTFTGMTRGTANWSKMASGGRYLVENVKEALSEPGEWYLDRPTGAVTYIAKPGEDPNRDVVVAPHATALLTLDGASNITFRGITFADAGFNIGPEGSSYPQAEVNVPAAITLTHCRNIHFEGCTIRNIGQYAVEMGAGAKNCLLDHCVLRDLGAGGIKIGTGRNEPNPADRAEGNVVRDCRIVEGGRVFPAGVGVWIGQSANNRIEHNEIADFYYTGISAGWTWGYAPTGVHDNRFADNDIHRIGQGVLSDMGGIYTLGTSPGTVLDHNRIYDVSSFDYGGWGIYFDEGTTGVSATNNIVYDCKSAAFHQHYGTNNILVNNILALGGDAALMRTRADNGPRAADNKSKELSFTMRRNIIYGRGEAPLFASNWNGSNFVLADNLYWSAGAAPETLRFPGGRTFAAFQASGNDAGSIIADPHFADAARRDFTLRPDSPALTKIGFQPIRESGIGPHGLPAYHDTAPRAFPAPPPPRPIADDWEDFAPGDMPSAPQLTVNVETAVPAATIRVTNETAARGKQSLKITDATGQKNRYDPHLYYRAHIDNGVATGHFALRFEHGSVTFYHEWRDAAAPYNVGPNLHIDSEGHLTTTGGRLLTTLPAGRWVNFEITCPLGAQANGTWDLTIRLPGRTPPQRFTGLPCGNAAFRQLRWWGFVSDGDAAATVYLDDMGVR